MKNKNKNKNLNNKQKDWRNVIWYFLLVLIGISVLLTFTNPETNNFSDFSTFMNEVKSGNIKNVVIKTNEKIIIGNSKDAGKISSYYVEYPAFYQDLRDNGVAVKVNPTNSGWLLNVLFQAFLPFLLILFLWFFIFRQAQGMNSQALSFGKSKAANWLNKKNASNKVTFKDVAGVDEAIEELHEIVEFLKQPEKFKEIGAKIPKGALLMGPPGTGKTLLAKAIAGESNVPFYSISGSDFVEMFVGVGASRVRDLFNQAKKNQPSIIFVDEIDAVGRHRGAGLGGGHDEREQTLNQLLVEMDGFDIKETVIIIAATNRPDILDPALLRPGRFDRQIVVDKPDISGRIDILKIHAKNKKISKNIDFDVIARRTPGFTGADLANLLNESCLLAARKSKKQVSMEEIEEATDRLLAGPERKSRVISEHEKKVIAYHEVGHAIIAKFCDNSDPVHKISILPRGMALGYTLQLPIEDKYLITRAEIEDKIKVLMGGRVAEEIIFKECTSGASNDIERATDLAKSYICQFGMSKKLGTRKYGKSNQYVFLGKDYSDHNQDYSELKASEIDNEIQKLIQDAYDSAKKILLKYKKELIEISNVIIKKEVIEGKEFEELLAKLNTKSSNSDQKKKTTKVSKTEKKENIEKPKN